MSVAEAIAIMSYESAEEVLVSPEGIELLEGNFANLLMGFSHQFHV